jgi:MYXO-CTERM domain-containing protein
VLVATVAGVAPVRADQDLDLEAIREAVRRRGAHFTVGETSRTRLTPDERVRRLLPSYAFPPGFDLARDLPRAGRLLRSQPLPPPPPGQASDPYFSWKDVGGVNWVTPIRDQGACGSCYTFGAIAAVEVQFRWLLGLSNHPVDLAEQEVISCIPYDSCGNGGTAEQVGMYLKNVGVCDETCFPYTSGTTGLSGECSAGCADMAVRRRRITDWHTTVLPTEATLKTMLLTGPVAVNMHVHDDFHGYRSGIYERSVDAPSGWHVVALVGWDDRTTPPCWIAKNSWGTNWGEQGFFRISRDETWSGWDCILSPLSATCFASDVVSFDVRLTDVQPDGGARDAGTARRDAATARDAAGPRDAGHTPVPDAARPDSAVARDAAPGVDRWVAPDAWTPPPDAGVLPVPVDAGTAGSAGEDPGDGEATTGCACRVPPAGGTGWVVVAGVLAVALTRRRRGR